MFKDCYASFDQESGIVRLGNSKIEKVLEITLHYCKNAVATQVLGMPRSLTVEELSVMAQKYCKTEIAKNYDEIFEKIEESDVVFVFGSLYLASAMRPKLKNFYKS